MQRFRIARVLCGSVNSIRHQCTAVQDKQLSALLTRQNDQLPKALRELDSGTKSSHWAWWAFPTEMEGASEAPLGGVRTRCRDSSKTQLHVSDAKFDGRVTAETAPELLRSAPKEWRGGRERGSEPNANPHWMGGTRKSQRAGRASRRPRWRLAACGSWAGLPLRLVLEQSGGEAPVARPGTTQTGPICAASFFWLSGRCIRAASPRGGLPGRAGAA